MGIACVTNRTVWNTTLGATGSVIENEVFVELQNAINRENTRRGMGKDTFTPTVDHSTISAINVKEIYDNIAQFKSMSWSYSYNSLSGVLITPAQLSELRINLNDAEDDCACDCNYCTCNCNYCTCNCNYCTCNCNYACTCVCAYSCTCQCNYACTCQCNYACTCNCNYNGKSGFCNPHSAYTGCPAHSIPVICTAHAIPAVCYAHTTSVAGFCTTNIADLGISNTCNANTNIE